jgi:hypothetical protein
MTMPYPGYPGSRRDFSTRNTNAGEELDVKGKVQLDHMSQGGEIG